MPLVEMKLRWACTQIYTFLLALDSVSDLGVSVAVRCTPFFAHVQCLDCTNYKGWPEADLGGDQCYFRVHLSPLIWLYIMMCSIVCHI